MPFNGSGTFTIINTFVPNTTILSAAVNQNFTDIATGLSDCLTRDGQAGMSAVFKAVSGSVSAPGITFNADATSGLFLSGSGIPGFVANSLGMLLDTQVFSAVSAVVQAGGSGYAVGDTWTGSGGTAISQPVFTVATLSGSAVATVTVTYPGFLTATASNPVSQGSTSGIGTGCTLNVTYNVPSSSDYRALFTDQAGAFLWQKFGASSFVSGLMNKPNALAFAQGIGASALTQVIGGTFLIPPQGILTPLSSTTSPIPVSDQATQTRIYWTPYNGNLCPIYNGTSFVATTSAQIDTDLTAGAQALAGIYDVYKFLNSGAVTLGLSPSWSAGTSGSVSAGSGARGTGTGGAALAVLNGILVNAVSMTVNNSSSTFVVPANQGTYLGSVYINAVAGQYNCLISYGQSRVWGLWNAYNRRPIVVQAGDTTSSWTVGGGGAGAFRALNGNTANSITAFTGLAEEPFSLTSYMRASVSSLAVNNGFQLFSGIGSNTTSSASGTVGTDAVAENAGVVGSQTFVFSVLGNLENPPALGINVYTALEAFTTAAPTATGGIASNNLTAKYRA